MIRWIGIVTTTSIVGLLASLRTDGVQPVVAPPPRPAGLNIRPGYVVVPLHRGPLTDWWYVDGQINGKAARLMVDTGAPMCVLHAHAAPKFGHQPAGPAQPFQLNGGGRAEFRQAVRAKLTVGTVSADAVRLQILSAPTLAPSFEGDGPPPCDGLLGAEFLHAHAAVVDYPAGLLHLRDPIDAEHGIQGRWVCVAREFDGVAKKEGDSPTRLQIRGSVATVEISGKKFQYRLWLDASCSPKRLDLVDGDDVVLPMIYRVEGGRITIAATLIQQHPTRVGQRPTKFRTAAGDAITVLTFEKEAD
jgi:uncharacterized protein (TIGR03067 family)